MKDHRLIETTEAFREEQGVTRRQALGKTAKLGLGLTLACAPAAATMLARRVYAQAAPPTPLEILNYALTLEYLEDSYYRQGLAATGLIPEGPARDAYTLISQHETAHVAFLTAVIEGLGGTPEDPEDYEDTDFDFTAGGAFDPFNEYRPFSRSRRRSRTPACGPTKARRPSSRATLSSTGPTF